MMKSKAKVLLEEQIARVREYLAAQEVGSDEYEQAFDCLMKLEEQLASLECSKTRNVIEIVKTVGQIMLPLIGLVCITAFEKEGTFTTALRGYVNLFIPKGK